MAKESRFVVTIKCPHWFLAGGSHNSVLVEYPTYLVMIEAPLDVRRGFFGLPWSGNISPE